MTERESLIALTHFVKFGPAGLKKLYARLGSWNDLWSAVASSLNHAGLDLKIANEFVTWRSTFNIEHSWKILDAEKIQIVCLDDDNYPEPLRNISQPPLVLYYQGKLRNSKTALAQISQLLEKRNHLTEAQTQYCSVIVCTTGILW